MLFFPAEDPTFSLLVTFASYIIILIMRPFYEIFFGNFGDEHRRKSNDHHNYGFSGAIFATGLLLT